MFIELNFCQTVLQTHPWYGAELYLMMIFHSFHRILPETVIIQFSELNRNLALKSGSHGYMAHVPCSHHLKFKLD